MNKALEANAVMACDSHDIPMQGFTADDSEGVPLLMRAMPNVMMMVVMMMLAVVIRMM